MPAAATKVLTVTTADLVHLEYPPLRFQRRRHAAITEALIELSQPTDGRILPKAMIGVETKLTPIQANTLETSNEFPNGFWRQYLRVSALGVTIYFDVANGAFVPR